VIYHRSIDWTLAPSSRARPIAGGAAPDEHEKRIGEANAHWPDWYADVGRLIKDNLTVGKEFVGGRLERTKAVRVEDLEPGQGGLIKVNGKAVGGYRDPQGTLHTVSLTCTHLGCPLHWNPAETSWDCRCHGSRYDMDGSILDRP
jgi:nitrite reductase/ring-hydroxylating ferredoxin subunit